MKLTTFLLFVMFFQVSAGVYSQNKGLINLKAENESLKEILRLVEDQSKYRFLYNSNNINVDQTKSINCQAKSIDEVLDMLFNGTDIRYRSFERTYVLFSEERGGNLLTSPLQQRTVSGKVTDSGGLPLPGVTVVIKGTTQGTVTNADGEYTLTSLPDNVILVFSFVGLKTQEVEAGDQTTINVTMVDETVDIEEVVAIGYGTMRKRDLTGTVARADIQSFSESPNISILQSLQGSVPGLNVGAVDNAGEDPSITIRGRTSISGSQTPLIIVDGIIFRGRITALNPHDIESIDVLKDASAAAIYGSQASNGVLLITTKRGKDYGKPVITYSGSSSFLNPANNKLTANDAEGFIKKIEDTFIKDSRIGPDYLQRNLDFNPVSHLQTPSAINGYNKGNNTDWVGLLTNDYSYIQDHNLSVTGKSKLSDYYISIGLTDQQNYIINDTYKRYSIRINFENKIVNWLKIGINSFYSLSDYSGISLDLGAIKEQNPLVTPFDEQGEIILEPYKSINPLLIIQQDDLDKRMNLTGNLYADIDIPFVKGLNYRINFSQNMVATRKYLFDPWGANYQGLGEKRDAHGYDWTFDNIITFKRNFDKHTVNSTFVYGREERQYEDTQAKAQIFANDNLGYNSLESGQPDLHYIASGAWDESSLYTMARLFYSYNNRYLITGTIRRDGFSGFGEKNKFGIFPSVAFGWVASEENFIKNNFDWIDNMKVRFSYGVNGNRTVGRYQTLAKLSMAPRYLYGDGANAEMGQWKNSFANSGLKWEKTNTFNAGIDFIVLDSRLFGSFDYYSGSTNDLLYNINIPIMNGVNSVPTNIGEIQNKGQEFNLTGIIIKTSDFNWQATFNFSRNRNKVVSIFGLLNDNDKDGREDDILAGGKSNSIIIGKPYGIWYDYEIIGMWQLSDIGNIPDGFDFGTYKIADLNADSKYTAAYDRKLLGYKDPSYRVSILNNFKYKDFELKVFINSIQGGKNFYYGDTAPPSNVDQVYQSNSPMWDYWTPENPDAKYRQIGSYIKPVGYNVHPLTQRSFVRLQDISLAYNIHHQFLDKIKIRTLKMFVTGKNLVTWTKWDGLDPETGVGIVGGNPVMKSYTIGLNVEF